MATIGQMYGLTADKAMTCELAKEAFNMHAVDDADKVCILVAPCHYDGTFRVAFIPKDGTLSLKCAVCGAIVGSVKVAEK